MQRAIRLATFILAGILLVTLVRQPTGAEQPPQRTVHITPLWVDGDISHEAGRAGIWVGKLTPAGSPSVVTCTDSSVYALARTATTYAPSLYAYIGSCQLLVVADGNGDGSNEVYVLTTPSTLRVLSGDSFSLLADVTLPQAAQISSMLVADVDGDGAAEFVATQTNPNALLVYDAQTLQLEWKADGKGGPRVSASDVDGDGQIEVVVHWWPTRIIDARLRVEEWTINQEFDAVGNIDADPAAELIYQPYVAGGRQIAVLDGATRANQWTYQLEYPRYITKFAIGDLDGDGTADLISGDDQWGDIAAFRGADGTLIREMPNPEWHVGGLAVGDADGDGQSEVVWSANLGNTADDMLLIADLMAQTVEWRSTASIGSGPLFTASGDVDNDGSIEFVVAGWAGDSSYGAVRVRIYDGATRQLERTFAANLPFSYVTQIAAAGQVDTDANLELIVNARDAGGATQLSYAAAFDLASGSLDWQGPRLQSEPLTVTVAANLDQDAPQEVIVGLSNGTVRAYNAITGQVEWESAVLDGSIRHAAAGDLDGDGATELVVLTGQTIYILEGATGIQEQSSALAGGRRLLMTNRDSAGPGELLIAREAADGSTFLVCRDHDLRLLWYTQLGQAGVADMTHADIDGDGADELVVAGRLGAAGSHSGLIWIGSQTGATYWREAFDTRDWGAISSVALGDLNGDEQIDLVVGRETLAHVYGASSDALVVRSVSLPVVVYNIPPPPTATPTPSPWITLVAENFEGDFPGPWFVWDGDAAQNGEYMWGKRDCRPYAGSYSGWAVGGGDTGRQIGCGNPYPNNSVSWMRYGPFSLADARAATLRFMLWLNVEYGSDGICRMVSTDGAHYAGFCTTGQTPGWIERTIDLANVPNAGNFLGQSTVYVALVFISDESQARPEGAYVDDIVLRKCWAQSCPPPAAPPIDGSAGLVDRPATMILPSP